MDDVLKAGGAVAGLGVGGATLMLAYRVYRDPVLPYVVVVAVLVIVAILAGAVYHNQRRRADEARAFGTTDIVNQARVAGLIGMKYQPGQPTQQAGLEMLLAGLLPGASGAAVDPPHATSYAALTDDGED